MKKTASRHRVAILTRQPPALLDARRAGRTARALVNPYRVLVSAYRRGMLSLPKASPWPADGAA